MTRLYSTTTIRAFKLCRAETRISKSFVAACESNVHSYFHATPFSVPSKIHMLLPFFVAEWWVQPLKGIQDSPVAHSGSAGVQSIENRRQNGHTCRAGIQTIRTFSGVTPPMAITGSMTAAQIACRNSRRTAE